MATTPVVANPSGLALPAATEIVASMSTTLDAYMNTLGMRKDLSRLRNVKREEFLKTFSPDVAANGSSRVDAVLQKFNEWKKTDEDRSRQVDGLGEISSLLWKNFKESANGYPEGAAALLKVKIQLLAEDIATKGVDLREVAEYRQKLLVQVKEIERAGEKAKEPPEKKAAPKKPAKKTAKKPAKK